MLLRPSHPSRLLALALLLAGSACQRHAAPTAGTNPATACIDPAKVNPSAICTMLYAPVCGCDGKTYSNACVADRSGVRSYTKGSCPGSN